MKDDCKIVGCLLANPLIAGQSKELHETLKLIDHPKNRIKYVINFLQKKQPPKVNKTQINRYFLLRKHKGIDLDKDYVTEKQKKYHAGLIHNPAKREIKINHSKGSRKKNSRSGLRTNNQFDNINERVDKSGKPIITLSTSGIETAAQFLERRKREHLVKQALAEPEPNFHEQ